MLKIQNTAHLIGMSAYWWPFFFSYSFWSAYEGRHTQSQAHTRKYFRKSQPMHAQSRVYLFEFCTFQLDSAYWKHFKHSGIWPRLKLNAHNKSIETDFSFFLSFILNISCKTVNHSTAFCVQRENQYNIVNAVHGAHAYVKQQKQQQLNLCAFEILLCVAMRCVCVWTSSLKNKKNWVIVSNDGSHLLLF